MLVIGERVICTKGEENWNTLVLGKTYEIADRGIDSLGQWIYKLKSDDGLITNWIEQWADGPIEPYFIPLYMHREEKLKEIGL
jgi:hypothetical protein